MLKGEDGAHASEVSMTQLGNESIEKETLFQVQLTEPYQWQNVDLSERALDGECV